jgi:predicted nucleic acid-binding protein
MPFFEIESEKVELRRDVVVLDTNVLYAAFKDDDFRHEDSLAYLEVPKQFVLPMSVIVETWGLLVGKAHLWQSGFAFLQWIIDPSSGVVVIHNCGAIADIHNLAAALRIDCVDATILYLADKITRQCRLKPSCIVATYDTRDFLRSLSHYPFALQLLDVTTLDYTEFDSE